MVEVQPPGLPAGFVTFVFTDIEGSTRILKRLPRQAPQVFERHDEIIRSALASHHGHEVNTDGDAFFAAFATVDDALAACADAQRSLAAEPWPEEGTVRVRMGVHAGVAAPRNDDYLALAVHQAARVVAAAHGGQIVVSETALDDAREPAPGAVVPLGRFRLRDFDEPEVLFRLDPASVPVVDRSVQAMPASGHNLVRPPTSFIGRDRTVEEVAALVSQSRLTSLTGPGGTGKTRLATEVGLHVAGDWPDGVWLVELADLADSTLVPAAIADSLGLAPTAGSDGWPEVLAWARASSSLLIVDNVETHVPVCAQLLSELVAFDGISILTTGREPLQIAGEVVYRVDTLPTPADDAEPEAVREAPAVRLFADRARAKRPDFDLDDASTPDVARLCVRLDGLPLAIEIAAARLGVLSVGEILEGLDDRFGLLRTTDRSLPERQRALSALLSWSYELLDPAEQTTFRRLAVFGGSFTVDSAVAALEDPELSADDVPELVWALVDKSLVVADLVESGTRYRLLETVRDFALQLLVEHGEVGATARRSAAALLDRVGPWFVADRGWIGEVGVELPNIRSLIDRLELQDQELAQALACSLAEHHNALQSNATGIEELTRAATALGAPTPTRVAMLTALADLHLRHADTTRAEELLRDAASLQSELGPPKWNDACVERTRGEILCRAGEYQAASEVARRALDGGLSPFGQARMWNLQGIAAYAQADMGAAFAAFQRELELLEQLGLEGKIAGAQGNLAEVAMHAGDDVTAATHQRSCLDLALAIGQPVMLAYSSLVAARLASHLDDWELAARLQASAESELLAAGHTLYPADQTVREKLRSEAIEHIGEAAFAAAERAGAPLGPVDAATLAAEVFTTVCAQSPTTQRTTDQRNLP